MYNNYGDVNFFEYGRLAEIQNDGTVNVLVCNPVFDCKNPDRCYQFDYINVDINDSWIDVNAVCSYADVSKDDIFHSYDIDDVCTYTKINKDDIIQFALACVDYYGTENFGGTAYYTESQLFTESEIKEKLESYEVDETIEL